MKRQLSEIEKQQVRQQQVQSNGSLQCFISGEIIIPDDDVEYDHIQAFSKEGETDVSNIRIVLKKYNRRKSDQTLYEVRDNLKLERLFEQKKNNIKLQDILELKEIEYRKTFSEIQDTRIVINDGTESHNYSLLYDGILAVNYFYGRVPIKWLENDDQEGLQPRVIDYKRLIAIRNHLKTHPQLAPSIGRLVDDKIKLFDGQHKLAGQVLNGLTTIDVKIYVSPESADKAKRLFDELMITNLEAHSKLKQIPFYTSTLLDRMSVIYKELLEEFIEKHPPERHTEENFINFLAINKQKTKSEAKELLRGAIKTTALEGTDFQPFVAKASKDSNYPITVDLLNKTIFPATLYLEPSSAKFNSEVDYRDQETENFKVLAELLVQESALSEWVAAAKSKSISGAQLKARRIWHKGSVLTWTPYLSSILHFALQFQTTDEREKLLYRPEMDERQKAIIGKCLHRLFSHPIWDEPEGEIDSLLVSAQKQKDLFERKGLTEKYVLNG